MSGQQIGGAVGFVVGAYFGYPQLGYMIGSALGAAVDPEKIDGPRLRDAQAQTAIDGIPISFGYGTFPTSGNIIWTGPLVEVRKNVKQGKGSGPVVREYHYLRSYAIGVCEGPIAGFLLIRRNGKVVYDARTTTEIQNEYLDAGGTLANMINHVATLRAASAKFIDRVTFYSGDETQLADPTIEAHEGVGNVAAFRGLSYIVVEEDDLTDFGGAIPQYEFVVTYAGTVQPTQDPKWWLVGQHASGNQNKIYYSDDAITWDGPYVRDPFTSAGESALQPMHWAVSNMFISGDGASSELISDYDPSDGVGTVVTSQFAGQVVTAIDGVVFGWQNSANGYKVSGDGGLTFTSHTIVSGRHMVAVARMGNLWLARTNTLADSGHIVFSGQALPTTWTIASSFPLVTYQDAIFTYSGGAFILDNLQGVTRTTNGDTWTRTAGLFPVTTGNSDCVGDTDDNGIWLVAVANNGNVYKSTDNGQSWSTIAAPSGNATQKISRIEYAGGTWVVTYRADVSFDATVWVSTNNGTSWTQSNIPVAGLGAEDYAIAYAHVCDDAAPPPGFMAIPDAPGAWVSPSGTVYVQGCSDVIDRSQVTLATIVAALCERAGLDATEYDVSQLTDLVDGYRIANEGGVDGMITPLMLGYFFGAAEWDKKLRFIKYGAAATETLTLEDLAEKDGEAVVKQRTQEAELLRKQTIAYLSPTALYTRSTQQAERRAGTIRARGESTIELPIVMDDDEAAKVADKRIKIGWSETDKFEFCLPYRFAELTPTDVRYLQDLNGVIHRVRILEIEDDSGVRHVKAILDRASSYDSNAVGLPPTPGTIVTPNIIGPTLMFVLDLPLWRSSDEDTLGLYVAASGLLGGWTGAQIDVSTDSGASYVEAAQVTTAATIGYTTTDLDDWATSENPEDQEVTVYLPVAPESVSYETLLRYNNRAVIQSNTGKWEILQYQTATVVDSTTFTLSGLVRGRYNTTPGEADSGATFILLDAAIQFVEVERQMLDTEFLVRASSYGTLSDNNEPIEYEFEDGFSQTEWPVHNVTAVRDTTGDIAVSCILRARLGVETAPYHSAHFIGVRFTYADGTASVSYDVSAASIGTSPTASHDYTYEQQVADWGTPPASFAVTVAPLNDITGEGPLSTGITV